VNVYKAQGDALECGSSRHQTAGTCEEDQGEDCGGQSEKDCQD